MDDRRFDAIARGFASGMSRRAMLAGLVGLGGLAAGGIDLQQASAARRGFGGPPILRGETPKLCSSDYDCGGDIVCCVGDCCKQGQSCVTDPNNNSYCE